MIAVLFALKAFIDSIKGKYVKILSDSTTAVSYINNFGGIKSNDCNAISKKIWEWCVDHDIWLICAHIPGIDNVEADRASRKFQDNIEWSLDEEVFGHICEKITTPVIDLFATRLNRKVGIFCSWKPDPDCTFVDAFSIDWGTFDMCYAFCPFSVIARCVQKIRSDQARCLAVLPLWPTQPWWSLMISLLVDRPFILPRKGRLLTLPHTEIVHPLSNQLVLIACRLSGHHSETEGFQNSLPTSSWPHGEIPQNGSTKCIFRDGYSSVINRKLIHFQYL